MDRQLTQEKIEAALERLFTLLPAHIRLVDANHGRALEALFQIFAEGDAEIDTVIQALFDNQFIETADADTLAHFAALTGTPMPTPLPPGNAHNFRSFIANSIRYNRGKGTARVLEQLTNDVTGLGAVAVEYFQSLSKLQHSLDFELPRPGTAAIGPGETAALAGRAFDRLPRVTDIRSIDRASGRYHFNNIGLHVLRFATPTWPAPSGTRVLAEDISAVPQARPWAPGGTAQAGYFQLAAQAGEVLALFNSDRRDTGRFERSDVTDLADRLRRLPLHLETEARRHAIIENRPYEPAGETWFGSDTDPFTIYFRTAGETDFHAVPAANIKIANLEKAPSPAGYRPDREITHEWITGGSPTAVKQSGTHPIACAFDPVTGRLIVAKPGPGMPDIEEVRVAFSYGRGDLLGGGPYERNAPGVPFEIVDRKNVTNFVRIVNRLAPAAGSPGDGLRTVATLADALSDWKAHGEGKTGWIILTRCDRETLSGGATTFDLALHPDSALTIVAAEWRENIAKPGLVHNTDRIGFIIRRERGSVIEGPVVLSAAAPPPEGGRAGQCTLDGLELTQGLQLRKNSFERLAIRHCTIRKPGSTAIVTTAALVGPEIEIDKSILGKCRFDFGASPSQVNLRISNSVLHGDGTSGSVLAAESCDTELCGVTVFGTAAFRSLEATNTLFTEVLRTTRRQAGCIRYSHVPPGSKTPKRFRCAPDVTINARAEKKGAPLTASERAAEVLSARPVFLDETPDAPGFAMLHPLCADAIAIGGEGETEIGVFTLAATRLRLRNMTRLFDIYLPFGKRAALLDDTQSRIVAEQRNRP